MNAIERKLPREIFDIIMSNTGDYKLRNGKWMKQFSRERLAAIKKIMYKMPCYQILKNKKTWSVFIYLGTRGSAVLIKQIYRDTGEIYIKYNNIIYMGDKCERVTFELV